MLLFQCVWLFSFSLRTFISLDLQVTGVGSKQRDYSEAIEKASKWLKEIEIKIQRLIQEPIGADPKSIQEQLDKAKTLNSEVVSQSRLFETCRQTALTLIRSLDTDLDAGQRDAIIRPAEELSDRYSECAEKIGHRCQSLDSALVQSQGVQEALDAFMTWLNNMDMQLR